MNAPARLLPRETFAVITIAGFLLAISLMTHFNRQSTPVHFQNERIRVTVRGAVAKPGDYDAPKKGALPFLLQQAEPNANAYISNELKITQVHGQQYLSIPQINTMDVYLSGAVQAEGWLSLPEKTRICELHQYISINEDADPKFLKRRKTLRNGECLCIPTKTQLEHKAKAAKPKSAHKKPRNKTLKN